MTQPNKYFRLYCRILIATVLVWTGTTSATAQTQPTLNAESSQPNASALQSAEIEKTIDALNDRLRELQKVSEERITDQIGMDERQRQQRMAELTAVVSAFEQLLGALRLTQSLRQETQVQADRLISVRESGLPQKPPYTLAFYDSILEDLTAAEQRKASAEAAIKISKRTTENLDTRKAAAEARWRLLSEQRDDRGSASQSAARVWAVESARLQLELNRALLLLEKKYLENHQLELQIAKQRIDINQHKLNLVRGRLVFEEAELNDRVESLENRKLEIGRRLQKVMEDQKAVEKTWMRAVKRLREGEPSTVAEAVLKSVEGRRNIQQTLADQLFDTQRLLGRQQEFWRHRYTLINDEFETNQLDQWQVEAETFLDDIRRMIFLQQTYQTDVQAQIAAIEKQRVEDISGDRLMRALGEELQALRTLAARRQDYVAVMIEAERLCEKLRGEIDTKRGRLTIGQRLSVLREDLKNVWNYEIVDIDNRPVTIRKVAVSVVILIIGMILAKVLIRYLTLRLLRFTRFRETTLSAIQKVVSFAAYLLVFLFALRMVNIPLAAFAFLGGAVAIGVGFGAQNLINNFISGFIIMGERPINIGDLIEVDGLLGQVEEIGARCTRVRTGENIHILVPNSSLLEKNITNWTHSDQMIRTRVAVGVAYGSPVGEVEKRLLEAAAKEPRVLDEPPPFVLFNDFGDNALTFAVHFWIRIKKIIERREIESRVRFNIDDLFRKAGIVIAFPQRDVHLDAHGPIDVRMIDKGD